MGKIIIALQQLNNQVITNNQTPLQQMTTPNLEIKTILDTHESPVIQWWKIYPAAFQPWHASMYAAGHDLFSLTDIVIKANSQQSIPTGIRIKIPNVYYGQI